MDKPIYNLVDGIPIWQHLKKGSEKGNMHLIANDFGRLAEMLGNRLLDNLISPEGGFLEKIIHSDIIILSVKRIRDNIGDYHIEISYKEKDKPIYGKKIVIFEIKHGFFQVEQKQLRRYCSMIINPSTFFKKSNDVKVFFLMFDRIDTMGDIASYSLKELDKDLARKVLATAPTSEGEFTTNYEKWKKNYDNQNTANLISELYREIDII